MKTLLAKGRSWVAIGAAITPLGLLGQGCPLGDDRDQEPLSPIEFSSRSGTATLIGFDELGTPSIPAKKYRRREISGSMMLGYWPQSGCPAPTSAAGGWQASGVYTSGSDTWNFTGTTSFTPESYDATTITYRARVGECLYTNVPNQTTPKAIGIQIWVYQEPGTFLVGKLNNNETVILSKNRTYSVYAYYWHSPLLNGFVGATLGTINTGNAITNYRDEWDAVQEYDGSDPSGTTLIENTSNSVRYKGVANAFPMTTGGTASGAPLTADYAGFVTEELLATSRTLSGTAECMAVTGGSRKVAGTYTEELSMEDKDEDALDRMVVSSGSSSAAVFTTRAAGGFSFDIQGTRATARFEIACPGPVQFRVDYTVEGIPHSQPFEKHLPSSGVHDVVVEMVPANYASILGLDGGADCRISVNAADRTYVITSIVMTKGCDNLQAGDNGNRQNSVHSIFGLGRSLAGSPAGDLRIESDVITAAMCTPVSLLVSAGTDVVVVRDDAGLPRQVKAPQALADIEVLDASSYAIRFFDSSSVGAPDPETGVFALNGTPYVEYVVSDPVPATQGGELRIAETRGSLVKVTDYAQDSSAGVHRFSTGNGLRREVLEESTSPGFRSATVTVLNPDDSVASKTARTWQIFPNGREEVVLEVRDPDGAALTTQRSFDAAGLLLSVTNSDGSWERRSLHDSLGRPLKIVRPFLNSAIGDPDTSSRATDYTYGTLVDADGDGIDEALTTTIETTLGTETGRTYTVAWSKPVTLGGEDFTRRSDIRCAAAGAAWNAATNLVTETLTYGSGPFNGRTRRVLNPDGTAILTAYTLDANGQQTTIVKSGVPNAAADDITDGTRTTTFTSAQGQVVGESITDIASGLTLSAWTATQFDALGRPTRLDYSDGTYETRDYACCGLASSRDRSGAVTSYLYDALGRQTHVTRGGVTTRIAYDADGRMKSVTRIGSDASEMVQGSSTYDLAGRQTERRDALSRLTTFGETFDTASGETTRTTTLADGGTVVEVTARDGSRLSVGGTAAAPRAYEYGIESGQLFTKETLVGDGGATTEWIKTFADFARRSIREERPAASGTTVTLAFTYNSLGQLVAQSDPDGIATLFAYNPKGEQEAVAVDVNGNGIIDFNGTDRVTKTTGTVSTRDTFTVQRSTTHVWETDGQDAPATVSVSEQSADGLRSWQIVRGLTTSSVTALDGSGGRTVTITAPDGTVSTQVFANDRLQSLATSHPALGQLSATTFTHDPHGRLETATDVRTGVSTYTYFADDQLHTSTTPDPDPARSGPGYDPQTTTYAYDSAGRVSTVTQPDGGVVTTEYYPTGQVKKTSGARTYPVEYTYDPQGRVKTLTTWQNFASAAGAVVTTWNYHPQRGWLDNKRYTDNSGPGYTYKPSGRMLMRTWARGVTTTYGYNGAGELVSVDYSDSTPDVTMAYDRAGRPKTIDDGAGARTLSYHLSGQLEDEAYTAGLLSGAGIDRSFDAFHRLSSLSVPSVNSVTYGYDSASRLDAVTAGANTASYGYVANSPLVGSVTFKNGASTRLTTVKSLDNLNRLASVVNTPSASIALSALYQYNAANQRTKLTRETSAYWDYGYDSLGQVTSAKKSLPGGVPMLGHDFGYLFDDIGNRKTATTNGQTSTYTRNLLNQYDSRTVPGVIDVVGAAQADATVTVTFPALGGAIYPTARQGEHYFKQLTVDNSTAAQSASIKVIGVKNNVGPNGEDAIAEEIRDVLVTGTPEVFTHDADGNLTGDAKWTYTWDGENRLIAMETSAAATAAGVPRRKLEFAYDGQSRRIAKNVYDWDGTAWLLGSSTRFLYDGWNMIAELDAMSSNAATRTYVWGLDLSGSTQGAGGVGGLLFATVNGSPSTAYCPAFDGNGNIIAYVDLAAGAKSATYEYGAFGETLIADGVAAEAMPFRFSTKYTDAETGLLYYGLRYYSPGMGRWLSRDPINELGSQGVRALMSEGKLEDDFNLYLYVRNEPTGLFDPFGLAYFAYRPLDSKAGKLLGVHGNKADDWANTMTAHEQLFFEDGNSPSNLGFFDDKPNGMVRSDKSALKFESAHDTGWNDCVMRKAVTNVKPSSYCLLGKIGKTEKYNCQDWAEAVRVEYRRLMQDPQVVSSCCPTAAETKK